MINNFFNHSLDTSFIRERFKQLDSAKVGFYSVGLYPASLAYNSAMQTNGDSLLLAPRPGRELLGAFQTEAINGMDSDHVCKINAMGTHRKNGKTVNNDLEYLILNCELILLSSNSNHVEKDLHLAINLRNKLKRQNVVLGCLAGSFCHNSSNNQSYVLCEKHPNLAFFSGFHRHGSLRNPLDSFTANFCHPDALTAMIGARLLDNLSPNIQVSSGVHNLEGQYVKAAKNISSIFAGFGHQFHKANPGVLPTLLTLLLDQCLDQAASVSMARPNRDELYNRQPFSLTELGYGVQKIEAALVRDGDLEKVRDHTFAQLTAMVADVRGSMMLPVTGKPTRNFQAGQILAKFMSHKSRCPLNMNEFLKYCELDGLKKGDLEGINALSYWPQILNSYSIPLHDSSMINLLYLCFYGSNESKQLVYSVMTQSRELSNYCQESVRPSHSRKYADALSNLDSPNSLDLLISAAIFANDTNTKTANIKATFPNQQELPSYIKVMNNIESYFSK